MVSMADGDDEIDIRFLALSLRALVEQLPYDVWVRDENDKVLFANASARRHWSSSVGRTVRESELQANVAQTWQATNARALAGETVRDEVVYARDGVSRTFMGVVTPVRDETGVRGTVGINVDVTGEKRARAEAQKLGQLLRDVFRSATVAMGLRAVHGDDLFHIEDNPRAAALMGSSPDGLRRRYDSELGVPLERIRQTIACFREAREANGPVSIELAYRARDGALRTLEGKAIAIEDPDEERYAFVAEDVSELRQLQTGLIRADRLASLGILSASIGHEIGTSAAVALGQLEMTIRLMERGARHEEMLSGLREAQGALLRAVGVLRDMRALALGATLGSEISDIDSAIDTVKDILRHDLDRHVTLRETRIPGLEVAMSHSRLVQILLNLVRNAIEAFGEGRGTLWIEVSRPLPDRVRVDIGDDGPGLPAGLRERLFEPFVSTKTKGTGLGLYVCNLLATVAGGSVEALPRESGGTWMRLDLPAVA